MKPVPISGEICILAGGLSSRMGRDKARLRLSGKSLLQIVKDVALRSAIRGGAAESAQYKSCTAERVLPPYQDSGVNFLCSFVRGKGSSCYDEALGDEVERL